MQNPLHQPPHAHQDSHSHQEIGDMRPTLTDSEGIPKYDNKGSLSTGTESGYGILGDAFAVEKVAHLNRERIPERPVHAKGAGAHGYFECTRAMGEYTCAVPFAEVGKRTPVFVRFSITISDLGTPDTKRDQRGFAIKMYTEKGNYDIVGLDKPVFFVRDWQKFVDLIHSQHRHPVTNLLDRTTYWDFLSLNPETMHGLLMNYTDRGTPRSYAQIEGFGVNTYMWYNGKGEHVWIKYHFIPRGGVQVFTNKEATEWEGKNPDLLTQDLFQRIEAGDYPTYTVYVQILRPEQADKLDFNPFDSTKVWPHGQFPLIEIGRLVLDRNPKNFFSDVEMVGFAPSNLIEGISFSPDKLLQGRLLTYKDAQRYRLGVNHTQLAINAPRCPVNTMHRDGLMRIADNADMPLYSPNSMQISARPDPGVKHVDIEVGEGALISRATMEFNPDVDFAQPRALWQRVLDATQKAHLVDNLVSDLALTDPNVQYRQTALFMLVDGELGERVGKGLGLDMTRVKHLAALSQEERAAETGPLTPHATLPKLDERTYGK